MYIIIFVIYVIEVDFVVMEYCLFCDKVLMIKFFIGLFSFVCLVIVFGWVILRSVISLICGYFYNYIRFICEVGWIFIYGIQLFNIIIVYLYGVGNYFDYFKLFIDVLGLVDFVVVLGKNWFVFRWVNFLKYYLIVINKLF